MPSRCCVQGKQCTHQSWTDLWRQADNRVSVSFVLFPFLSISSDLSILSSAYGNFWLQKCWCLLRKAAMSSRHSQHTFLMQKYQELKMCLVREENTRRHRLYRQNNRQKAGIAISTCMFSHIQQPMANESSFRLEKKRRSAALFYGANKENFCVKNWHSLCGGLQSHFPERNQTSSDQGVVVVYLRAFRKSSEATNHAVVVRGLSSWLQTATLPFDPDCNTNWQITASVWSGSDPADGEEYSSC